MIIAIYNVMTIQSLFNRGSIPLAEQAIYYANARHKAIANNIANVETPGYKAIDVSRKDFLKMVDDAVTRSKNYDTEVILFEETDTISFDGTKTGFEFIEREPVSVLRHDNNNVDLDIEVTEMAKNRGIHNASAMLINHQFILLREAISTRL